MRVLFAAAECEPFIKTGGLADVVGALPKALVSQGIDTRVLLPAYGNLNLDWSSFKTIATFDDIFGGAVTLRSGQADGLSLILLDAPHLFARTGNPYVREDGTDWPDNALRFAGLSWIAAHIAANGVDGWAPDILHVHDWHTGLAPVYLNTMKANAASVMTIHNIAYQGLFPGIMRTTLGLPKTGFADGHYNHYGQVSFLKAGITGAGRVTTVSPAYADELKGPNFGMGLDDVVIARGSDMVGILNGIDITAWDPATDTALVAPYSAAKTSTRVKNKTALLNEVGLPRGKDKPLLCVISRMTPQKGLDVLLDALPGLIERDVRLAVLGSGDRDLEEAYTRAATAHPKHISVRIGYDAALARRIHAGADAIVVPSRFEPCGLTQLCGLRYGTIPLVARTGGLADTIIDANPAALAANCATGFQFHPTTVPALLSTVDRMLGLYADKKAWRRLVVRAMRHPVSWDESASAYASLYDQAIQDRQANTA